MIRSVFTPFALFLIFAAFIQFPMLLDGVNDDPGLGWHLATGKLILDAFSIPVRDPFLHWTGDPPVWIADQWLSDLFLVSWFTVFGFEGLAALTLIIFCSIIALASRSAREKTQSPHVAGFFALIFLAKLLEIQIFTRPVVFSIFLFAVLWFASPSKQLRRDVLGLTLFFCVWANIHPAFVLGLFALPFGRFVSCYPLGSRMILLGAAFLGSCFNPYGIELHRSIISLSQSEFFMNLHTEWLPLNWSSNEGRYFLFSGVIAALGVLVRRRFSELVVVGIFAVMAIDTRRILPYYAIVAFPFYLAGFSLLTNLIASRFSTAAGNFFSAKSTQVHPLTYVLLPVLLSLLSVWLYESDLRPSEGKYPYRAVQLLLDIQPGANLIVGAHPNDGGFITWFGKGHLKPILDDRNTLIGERRYRERWAMLAAPYPERNAVLRELGVDVLLLRSGNSDLSERTDRCFLGERVTGGFRLEPISVSLIEQYC